LNTVGKPSAPPQQQSRTPTFPWPKHRSPRRYAG